MPAVKEKLATDPVPPLFPQAPQVSHLGESSTSFSTVTAGGGALVGVGDGDALGLGFGEGDALATGVVAELEEVLPPHPLTVSRKAIRSTEMSKLRLRTVHPPRFGLKTLGGL